MKPKTPHSNISKPLLIVLIAGLVIVFLKYGVALFLKIIALIIIVPLTLLGSIIFHNDLKETNNVLKITHAEAISLSQDPAFAGCKFSKIEDVGIGIDVPSNSKVIYTCNAATPRPKQTEIDALYAHHGYDSLQRSSCCTIYFSVPEQQLYIDKYEFVIEKRQN